MSIAMNNELDGTFAALKRILVKLAAGRSVVHDDSTHYYLNSARSDAKGKPVFFAAVKIGAKKVAFHLMPVYENPSLLEGASIELKRRMQGKSCFNFNAPDEALMKELEALAQSCAKADIAAQKY